MLPSTKASILALKALKCGETMGFVGAASEFGVVLVRMLWASERLGWWFETGVIRLQMVELVPPIGARCLDA